MTTYTANAKLSTPGVGDTGWAVPVNANTTALDALAPVGALCVTTHEMPSTSLNVDVAPGSFTTPWGQTVSYAGTTSKAMGASLTTYVWLTTSGVLTTGTAWPTTAYVPLAIVTASAATITGIVDARPAFSCVVPVAQPTLGAATAGSTYTTNEQTMLNTLWTAFRSLGLGS